MQYTIFKDFFFNINYIRVQLKVPFCSTASTSEIFCFFYIYCFPFNQRCQLGHAKLYNFSYYVRPFVQFFTQQLITSQITQEKTGVNPQPSVFIRWGKVGCPTPIKPYQTHCASSRGIQILPRSSLKSLLVYKSRYRQTLSLSKSYRVIRSPRGISRCPHFCKMAIWCASIILMVNGQVELFISLLVMLEEPYRPKIPQTKINHSKYEWLFSFEPIEFSSNRKYSALTWKWS